MSCLFITNFLSIVFFIINNYINILIIDEKNILFIAIEAIGWILFTLILILKGA